MCQMVFMGDLPAAELESLGRRFLALETEKAINKAVALNKPPPKGNPYSVAGDSESTNRILLCLVRMFLQAQDMCRKFQEDVGQVMYLTPVQFLRVFKCYKKLLKVREENVKSISGRYEEGLDKIRQK